VAGGEQKKARQRRRRKPRPAGDGDGGDEQSKKRRLSDEQARFLELSFRKERKLETPRKVQLAAELGLDAKQVAVWFQNRRARHKSKLMEEEFSKLRASHDAVVIQNCHLETEVINRAAHGARHPYLQAWLPADDSIDAMANDFS
jgi:homeobox-leucine zipper protein